MTIQRRSFLKLASLAAAGNAAALNPFGGLSALAQSSTSDYKALVCILLQGGNDGNNMLIPSDSAGYSQYAAARQSLALSRSSLLGLSGSTTLALHPSMPELQQLFEKNKAAFLLNTGSLIAPLTREEYLADVNGAAGSSLFSHYDQTNFLQAEHALSSDSTGWGGRVADAVQSSYGTTQLPTVVSVSGAHTFGNGKLTQGYTVTPGTATASVATCWQTTYCPDRLGLAQQLLTMSSGATLAQADGELTSDVYRYAGNLASALKSVSPVTSPLPSSNPLASQLQQIMQIMQVRSSLGARRQVFFATLNGFDTHASQLGQHATMLDTLSAALGSFYTSLEQMGLGSQVTTFTVSDFGRALQGNSQAGSDHAWGNHQIIIGDAVKGGKTYGTFPSLTLGGQNDAGNTGRWIPTTSTTQYAATLASWFGVPAADLATVFPLSPKFAKTNLGFV